jgi:O-antigen/teichoic acid export membrane protein
MNVSKAKTFRNIIYAALTKGATLLCAVITTMVVARNLTAGDYGVVGFATIVIGFLLQFTDMGLMRAAIRRQDLQLDSLYTALTLKAILGCVAFAVALLIAPFARHFIDHPATGNVIRILALEFIVSTIGFVPAVVLTREINYRALTVPVITGALVQCMVAVILVRSGWSYWAVVIADVGGTFAVGVAMQFTRKIPTHFSFDWADAREYLRFGIPLFASGIVIFIILNLDNFLVSTSMGSVQLGYYALAFTCSTFICMFLNETVNNVLLPSFAAMQDNPVAMRRWYLKTIELVSFVAVIGNTALLVNASFFLVTFLGKGSNKWLPAMLALRILCVYGIVRAITVPIGACIMARGHTNILFRANVLAGSVEVILLLLAIRSGKIELVAAAVLIAYLTQAVVYLPYLRMTFSITYGDFIAQVWPVVPAMAVGWIATSLLPITFGNTFLTLAARGAFTAVVVALTHGLFSRFRCFQEAHGLITHNWARING